MSSHSRMSKGGKKASACWGVSSISVRYSFWASGRASLYTLSPPMMNISSSSLQCDRASCKLLNVSAPGKTAALFLLSTILRRLGNAPLGKDSNVLRPMMMVCPVVSALKRFRSSGKPVQQAVFKTDGTVACNSYDNGYHVGMVRGLYGNRTGNVRPRIIVFQCEVFELEVEDAFHVRIELHARQGTRFPGEL